MKIPDLKKRLSENDQIVTGTKAELIKVSTLRPSQQNLLFFLLPTAHPWLHLGETRSLVRFYLTLFFLRLAACQDALSVLVVVWRSRATFTNAQAGRRYILCHIPCILIFCKLWWCWLPPLLLYIQDRWARALAKGRWPGTLMPWRWSQGASLYFVPLGTRLCQEKGKNKSKDFIRAELWTL